uniref:Uncharacterized protein n=1 Tax=Euplotes harpa TaxID=151035 RepID=A0A7S3JCZ8_9SPIT|mmetsp:Transcript_30925/g.35317  ORF Transcript_30925/g.35317 Transcript_30925/m.35317 type:complete len:148 (+) Transcript_30925:655-1098(+)
MRSDLLNIVDSVMRIFKNTHFVGHLKRHIDTAFPLFVPLIVDLAVTHWFVVFRTKFVALATMIRDLDPEKFEAAQDPTNPSLVSSAAREQKRRRLDVQWETLDAKLKSADPSYERPAVPYRSDALLGDYNELYRHISQGSFSSHLMS